ncbi:uncharacterized protein IUM83_00878 [Phytophthora cinnamomi]|uniref:uncharacterized protein n=1 Tax=Phytophthora cinnamomi TaxID=4785 RepID=UPI00355A7ED3|nr:hypothetical protein IUM83_00878 [Phytophthora cinnamomi]
MQSSSASISASVSVTRSLSLELMELKVLNVDALLATEPRRSSPAASSSSCTLPSTSPSLMGPGNVADVTPDAGVCTLSSASTRSTSRTKARSSERCLWRLQSLWSCRTSSDDAWSSLSPPLRLLLRLPTAAPMPKPILRDGTIPLEDEERRSPGAAADEAAASAGASDAAQFGCC